MNTGRRSILTDAATTGELPARFGCAGISSGRCSKSASLIWSAATPEDWLFARTRPQTCADRDACWALRCQTLRSSSLPPAISHRSSTSFSQTTRRRCRSTRLLGATAAPLRFGTHPEFFQPAAARSELACEVLMVGHANPDRLQPVKRLAREFQLHVYGEGWDKHGIPSRGLIFGEDSLAALASAFCVVVFHRGLRGDPLIKPSLFDFTAAGALVVTNYHPAIEPYFVFGDEIVGFHGEEDLVPTIRRLLEHPQEAERIRRAGRARTLR